MIAEQRLAHILSEVEEKGTVTVPDLARDLGISKSTVRRDLEKLDSAKKLTKVHGGATRAADVSVPADRALAERVELNAGDKRRIAAFAATLVQAGDFVYIDAGTSTQELVERLEEHEATYVTDSPTHAQRLVARGMRAVLIGGELKGVTGALVGPDALDALGRYHFDIGFWGANGVTAEHGFTTPDRSEALVKRVSIENAERRYVLVDPSKFDQVAAVRFAAFEDAAVITTEVPPAFESFGNVVAVG